jgi:outer membrane protein assembly factor BamB
MKIIILFCSIVLLGSSCKKEIPFAFTPSSCYYCPVDTPKYQVIWQVPIFKDTNSTTATYPFIWKDIILIPHDPETPKDNSIVSAFDRKTGKPLYEWNGYNKVRGANAGDPTTVTQIKDKMIFNTDWRDIYVLDAQTGQIIWTTNIESGNGSPRISSFGNFIYHNRPDTTRQEYYLMRANVNIAGWDTIYSVINHERVSLVEPPTGYINPAGDTLLIFQNRSYVIKTSKGIADLYIYNLTKKRDEFIFKDFDPNGSATSVEPPVIYKNKLYFMGSSIVLCINLESGKIEWQRNFHDSFSEGSLVVAEEKLFVKTDNGGLYAVNLQDGTIIWQSGSDYGSSCSRMVYYNGYLYYTGVVSNGGLFVVQAATGYLIWNYKSINEFDTPLNNYRTKGDTFFGRNGGVTIDSALNCLYVTDNRYLMCIKLPK